MSVKSLLRGPVGLVLKICLWLAVALCLLLSVFTIFFVSHRDNPFGNAKFGIAFMHAEKASIADVSENDLIVVDCRKSVIDIKKNEKNYKVGDMVIYSPHASAESSERTQSYMFAKITKIDGSGASRKLTVEQTDTKSTATISISAVYGVYRFSLPAMGAVTDFAKSPFGYVLFALLPFLIILAAQALTIVKAAKLQRESSLRDALENDPSYRQAADENAELKRKLEELEARMNKK